MQETIEITNVRIITEDREIESGSLQIRNGKINTISDQFIGGTDKLIDGKGKDWTLLPGFIDVHIHGANGHDVMDATHEALDGMSNQLPKEGTTSFLSTTMTQSPQDISKAVSNAGEFIELQPTAGQAEVLGIHLEGPFISEKKVGAQPIEHVMLPSIKQFKQWQGESQNHIQLVTMAPEVDGGLEFIEYLTSQQVVASIGHSNATLDIVNQAVHNGARHVTHLYNQMSGLHHREPGVVGGAFLNDQVKVEMIVDYIHVHEDAIKLAYQFTQADRTILITDAMRAKCLPAGTYDLGGQDVIVNNGEARLSNGALAGSILTLEEAARNMKRDNKLSYADVASVTSTNAAKQLNVFDRKGSITLGKDADLVLLDEEDQIMMTICRGKVAYDRRGEAS